MEKDARFEIRLSKAEKAELDRLAKAMNMSAAELLRRVVIDLAKKVMSEHADIKPEVVKFLSADEPVEAPKG
jgi:predicted transcriptional regulator